MPNVAI